MRSFFYLLLLKSFKNFIYYFLETKMDFELPDSFDVIVIGTGLGESMIAASLSRIGKSVLHIDRNEYYGSQWATFTFDSIIKWAEEHKKLRDETDNENLLAVPQSDSSIQNIEIRSFIPDVSPKEEEVEVERVENTENEKQDESNVVQSELENQTIKNKEKEIDQTKEKPEDVTAPKIEDKTETIAEDQSENKTQDEIKEKLDTTEAIPDQLENKTQNEVSEETKENSEANVDVPRFNKKPNQSAIVSQAKIKQKLPNISLEDFSILSRKFCLDTNPKFLFSAGPLVNAIIKANISHYSEFQVVNRILTCKDNKIVEVPCNRSDIFSSSFLSMIEKRTLMKYLTLCLEFDPESPTEELAGYLEKPFVEYLQSRRLSKNLQLFIIHSIAMVKPETKTVIGLKETYSFLRSLGKYGKSPFIWPLYGVGELPQAFCRMSAVFGAVYCLSKSPVEITVEDNKCHQVVFEDKLIKCDYIVMERNYLPKQYLQTDANLSKVSKAILITNSSILPAETEFISFLTIPPLQGQEELVRVIELGSSGAACPAGLFVVYLCCHCTNNAVEDLQKYVDLLTHTGDSESNKPKLLWSLYFNELENNDDITNLPDNLFVTDMPGSSLGFRDTVADAEEIVKKICPEGEFLMAVPNPEDILWDQNENKEQDSEKNAEDENVEKEEEEKNEDRKNEVEKNEDTKKEENNDR